MTSTGIHATFAERMSDIYVNLRSNAQQESAFCVPHYIRWPKPLKLCEGPGRTWHDIMCATWVDIAWSGMAWHG